MSVFYILRSYKKYKNGTSRALGVLRPKFEVWGSQGTVPYKITHSVYIINRRLHIINAQALHIITHSVYITNALR